MNYKIHLQVFFTLPFHCPLSSLHRFKCGWSTKIYRFDFWCFNATFSNISAISWRLVLMVEKAGENHWPWASNW